MWRGQVLGKRDSEGSRRWRTRAGGREDADSWWKRSRTGWPEEAQIRKIGEQSLLKKQDKNYIGIDPGYFSCSKSAK
jgi:hypothetical protein